MKKISILITSFSLLFIASDALVARSNDSYDEDIDDTIVIGTESILENTSNDNRTMFIDIEDDDGYDMLETTVPAGSLRINDRSDVRANMEGHEGMEGIRRNTVERK